MRGLGWMLAGTLLLAPGGCVGAPFALLLPAQGAFKDGTTLGPFQTGFAVYDRHRRVENPEDGSVTVEEREEGKLVIVLSGASFDPTQDLASMSASEIEDLRQEVRRADLVLVTDLGASHVKGGARVSAATPPPSGDFNFLLRRAPATPYRRNPTYADSQPLGSDQKLVLEISNVWLVDNGRLEAQPMTVELAQGAAQSAGASTGQVAFRFNIPVLPERLGESNLALLDPALH